MVATAHLVFGPIAAGKSTYTASLAARRRAVVFTVDDLMQRLFGPDRPEPLQLDWALGRVERCRRVIWSLASQVLALGTDVILDTGLMRAADRQAAVDEIRASGHAWALHFVDAPRDVRRTRIAARNTAQGDTHSFHVTVPMFEAMDRFFESPTPAEQLQLSGMPRPA